MEQDCYSYDDERTTLYRFQAPNFADDERNPESMAYPLHVNQHGFLVYGEPDEGHGHAVLETPTLDRTRSPSQRHSVDSDSELLDNIQNHSSGYGCSYSNNGAQGINVQCEFGPFVAHDNLVIGPSTDWLGVGCQQAVNTQQCDRQEHVVRNYHSDDRQWPTSPPPYSSLNKGRSTAINGPSLPRMAHGNYAGVQNNVIPYPGRQHELAVIATRGAGLDRPGLNPWLVVARYVALVYLFLVFSLWESCLLYSLGLVTVVIQYFPW